MENYITKILNGDTGNDNNDTEVYLQFPEYDKKFNDENLKKENKRH